MIASRSSGKERDSESGLDYFGARYYGSSMGRFSSPDIPFVDQHPADPQSWNLYSYARNNPLHYTDPTGRCVKSADASEGTAASSICQPTANLQLDEAGKTHLRVEETTGKSGKPDLVVYDDGAGNPTVGFGHKVTKADGLNLKDKITAEQAEEFFNKDVAAAEAAVRAHAPKELSQNEFNALVDLVFNAGPGVLTTNKSPELSKAMGQSDYAAMAKQLRYTKATIDGKVVTVQGLIDRSDKREKMFNGTP